MYVRVCVHACVRAFVRVCVRACMCVIPFFLEKTANQMHINSVDVNKQTSLLNILLPEIKSDGQFQLVDYFQPRRSNTTG